MATRFCLLHGILVAFFALGVSAAGADKPRDLKVFVKLDFGAGSVIGPRSHGPQSVIRSAEELAANKDPKKAKDPAFQKQLEAQLAKLLKVDKIDWDKQMVVAFLSPLASLEPASRSSRSAVDFVSFKVQADQLTVLWTAIRVGGGCGGSSEWPNGMALIERFNGPVLFNPAEQK